MVHYALCESMSDTNSLKETTRSLCRSSSGVRTSVEPPFMGECHQQSVPQEACHVNTSPTKNWQNTANSWTSKLALCAQYHTPHRSSRVGRRRL